MLRVKAKDKFCNFNANKKNGQHEQLITLALYGTLFLFKKNIINEETLVQYKDERSLEISAI